MAGNKRPEVPEIDLAAVDEIVASVGTGADRVIPLLQAIQGRFNYLPRDVLRRVCDISDITPAAIAGVSTFYDQFRHRPAGRHCINVCVGTACHVKGADRISDAIRRHLGIGPREDTDPDRQFTVQPVACLGCCTLAPAVQIDDKTYGHLTPNTVGEMIEDFLSRRGTGGGASAEEDASDLDSVAEIRIGQGSCCIAAGSLEVRQALEQAAQGRGSVRVKPVGCVGMCHQTPLVEVVDRGGQSTLYAKVQAGEATRIVERHFRPKGLARRVGSSVSGALGQFLTDEVWDPITRYAIDVRDQPVCAFLGRQQHIASEHCGDLSPFDLDEYIRGEGYVALRRVLDANDPESVIGSVTESGLRGRGGAGFPTGRKWAVVRSAEGSKKYVVMNGDEGDPGAFMDRMLLESYPYRILEGITIAAFAVGAQEGVLYIRAEYPLAVTRVRHAIAQAEERGFLGDNILGSGCNLHLRIMEGAGAFVCGEETALLASIEGRRGMPRFRPPFPAQRGLHGKPTLINNVETFACLPWIFRHGPEAFAGLGQGASQGTKVFSLAGKIRRGGLIEVPMGITIREIVEEIGGGVADGRRFKAVQIGGPSGGCIPARLAETPVDYEALIDVGAIMGSGGLVVLDDTDCMVDIARYFLQFTQNQSCGKCTHCRVGTKRMLEILERLCAGGGRSGDLERLEQLARQTVEGSLCGLGRTAPNPVLSTLRHFRDEYEAHLSGRCPAGVCKGLIAYRITDACIGCTRCAQHCPVDAIPLNPYRQHSIDEDLCTRCNLCREVCPSGAVVVE